ncbi:MAG: Uncharacterized protein CEN90_648 [Parcubacteria group bacterium Licking1014_17]|nr:MAG: Uncharacterized protein CEN90_648 [Parcubacteria group bacterium Licking1014_17]
MNDGNFTVEPLSPATEERVQPEEQFETMVSPSQNPPVQVSPLTVEPQASVKIPWLSAFLTPRQLKYVMLGGLGIIILAVALFFIFRSPFNETRVSLSIEATSSIASGQEVTYKVAYKNGNRVTLKNVKLAFFYPEDSVPLKDGQPAAFTNETVDIGEIGGGGSSDKTFTAIVVGDKGDVRTARAILTYRPSTITSYLQKEVVQPINVMSLEVPLAIDAPQNAISGQSVRYVVTMNNEAGRDINYLRLKATYPRGFRVTSSSPQAAGDNDTWDIASLPDGKSGKITVQGVLVGVQNENKTISFLLQRKMTLSGGEDYVNYEKSEATTVLSLPPLSAQILVNNSDNYTAHLGDRLQYTVILKNNSNSTLERITLTSKLEGNMYDYTSVDTTGFFDSREKTISWNASSFPQLLSLGPNQEARISFTVALNRSFAGSAKDSSVKASVHSETSSVPSGYSVDKIVSDSDVTTRITTSPSLDNKVFVSDPVFGSGGPMPLKVDVKSFFTVKLSLVNPSNDLSSAKIRVVLAPGVTWQDRVRVSGNFPPPVFDPISGIVSWNLGILPGGAGTKTPAVEAYFQISVTPSVNQINQTVLFTRSAVLEGTDNTTNEFVARTLSELRSSNLSDYSGNSTVAQ